MFSTIFASVLLAATPAPSPADPLTAEIKALDGKVFDAYTATWIFSARPLTPRSHSTTTPVVRRSTVTRLSRTRASTSAAGSEGSSFRRHSTYILSRITARSRRANIASANWRADDAKASRSLSSCGQNTMGHGVSPMSSAMVIVRQRRPNRKRLATNSVSVMRLFPANEPRQSGPGGCANSQPGIYLPQNLSRLLFLQIAGGDGISVITSLTIAPSGSAYRRPERPTVDVAIIRAGSVTNAWMRWIMEVRNSSL